MSLNNVHKGGRSLAFSLTLFYSVFFGLVSSLSLALIYHHVSSRLLIDVDRDLVEINRQLSINLHEEDTKTIGRQFSLLAQVYGNHDCFLLLSSSNGVVRATSDMSEWRSVKPIKMSGTNDVIRTIPTGDERGFARVLAKSTGSGDVLELGVSLEGQQSFLERLREVVVLIEVVMLTLGTIIGWGIARKAMKGVENVTEMAAKMAGGDLAGRVMSGRYGREIDRLGLTFNQMADKIEYLMRDIRQTNDNIAHDLRSPVTRMRGIAEAAVVGKVPAAEQVEALGVVVEECDRLLELVNTLLDISEAEAGINTLRLEMTDIAGLVRQAADLFKDEAEARGIELAVEIEESPRMAIDVRKIQRALANLIDNALKYSVRGGKVFLILTEDEAAINIGICDTGIGIDEKDIPHLFQRFYRCDQSRSQPGSGLGLSLALAFVKSHGGDLSVVSRLGHGSTFTVSLFKAP